MSSLLRRGGRASVNVGDYVELCFWFLPNLRKAMRKEMPRQGRARLDAPGTLHYVIVRGSEKRKIVDEDKDRDQLVLIVTIDEGVQTLLSEITFDGHTVFTGAKLQEVSGLSRSDAYNEY